jgi:hypothetical protein
MEVLPPKEFIQRFGKDFILFRTYWITNEKLGAVWKNRFQNASSTSGKKSSQCLYLKVKGKERKTAREKDRKRKKEKEKDRRT